MNIFYFFFFFFKANCIQRKLKKKKTYPSTPPSHKPVFVVFNRFFENDIISRDTDFLRNLITSFSITTLEGLFKYFIVLTAQSTLILLFVDCHSPCFFLPAVSHQAVQAHPGNLKIQESAIWQSMSACPLYLFCTLCIF